MDGQIKLTHVSRTYGEHQVQAVRPLDLEIPPGEFVALMGPSGCGKSTLLNLIGLMDTPSTGTIEINGHNTSAFSDEQKTEHRLNTMGFVFQFFNLLPTLTVEENVSLPLSLQGVPPTEKRERVFALLEKLGLQDRLPFYPSQLSGGQMQRVAIARALIHAPRIIIADEPTGNLDFETGQDVLNLLKKLTQETGQTIVMATHSEDVSQFATKVLRMRDGQLL